MLSVIRYALFFLVAASCIAAAYASVNARRKPNPLDRGLMQAYANISMGVMLLSLSIVAMLMFSGSTPAVIVEAVFMVLGAFHIFAGLRSRSHYSRLKSAPGETRA